MDLNKVKLIVYDFDGVLTDNRVLVDQEGREAVVCNRSDGWWFREIRNAGFDQIIISSETNSVVSARAKKLSLEVSQGHLDKKSELVAILETKGIDPNQVCYVGNDVNDLGCFELAGYTLCPRDSHPAIIACADLVLPVDGGAGLVRYVHQALTADRTVDSTRPACPPPGNSWVAHIQDTIKESFRIRTLLLDDNEQLALLETIGETTAAALKNGKKVLLAGNGGSFADAMHLAAEFVSKLQRDRDALPALALGSSNSNLTAIGNDYGYEQVFVREIRALGNAGDVFIAISTSGNSPNILAAVRAAKEKGLFAFGLSGQSGGHLRKECPTIRVPSSETARIQECHIMLGHLICEMAEASFLR